MAAVGVAAVAALPEVDGRHDVQAGLRVAVQALAPADGVLVAGHDLVVERMVGGEPTGVRQPDVVGQRRRVDDRRLRASGSQSSSGTVT